MTEIWGVAALFGLSHGIVARSQYSLLVAAVIGSAVVPTMIASAFFLPRDLSRTGGQANATAVVAPNEAIRRKP